MDSLENYITSLNSSVFWKEFTFSKNQFSPNPGTEYEFADNIVWLQDMMLIFQLKERNNSGPSSPEDEATWFTNKVLKKGTRQVRDTLKYLGEFKQIEITNLREHKFNLADFPIKCNHSLIVYHPNPNLPSKYRSLKCHISKTIGLIHLMDVSNYWSICKTLVTPAEVFAYLSFRSDILMKHKDASVNCSEEGLLGQFLWGEHETVPSETYRTYFTRFINDTMDFDFSFLFANFKNQLYVLKAPNPQTAYYHILFEFAKLRRTELRRIMPALDNIVEKCKIGQSTSPFRLLSLNTGCAFLLIAISPKYFAKRLTLLENLTAAAKYDLKTKRCIGLSATRDLSNSSYILLEWCFMDQAWTHDPVLENAISTYKPFHPIKITKDFHYKFSEN